MKIDTRVILIFFFFLQEVAQMYVFHFGRWQRNEENCLRYKKIKSGLCLMDVRCCRLNYRFQCLEVYEGWMTAFLSIARPKLCDFTGFPTGKLIMRLIISSDAVNMV